MAMIRKGILNSQKAPEPIDLDSKIYGVDGLPTKSEHMPNLNVVRTDDAVGMTSADFHNVFPFNEIVNENVPSFAEYGRWDEKYNTFNNQNDMIGELSNDSYAFYEHLFGMAGSEKPSSEWYGTATHCKIYVKDPNNKYKYVLASGTKFIYPSDKPIAFDQCVYYMDNMNDFLQELMEGADTSYVYPVVRYGFLFIIIQMTAVTGYIYYNGTKWVRTEEAISMTDSYVQPLDDTIPKQEITTSSVFKTLDDNKYWRYNGGTSYTIADFDEIPIPLTPTKRIPKFYVKRGMNPDGTWYEKISETKHDETWLCHKAFISDDGLEKPYLYVASEIVTSSYRDLREDRGNFKVYGETEYDMFETLFRIAYASWMSTYDDEGLLVIADLREFGIEYLDCVLRVDTKYDESIGASIDGVGFGRPFADSNNMSMRVSNIDTFRNAKGEGASSLRVPENAPDDGAIYHFNEIEVNGNDIFKYVDIVNEHDDPNPVIRQSVNPDVGPEGGMFGLGFNSYQALSNDLVILPIGGKGETIFDGNITFEVNDDSLDMPLSFYSGAGVDGLYDLLASGSVTPMSSMKSTINDTVYNGIYAGGDSGVYVVVNEEGDNYLFIVLDTTLFGMPYGKVIAFIENENVNYLKIDSEGPLTVRGFEYLLRSGTFWRTISALLEAKRESFNPTVMELETYTKINNQNWELWGTSGGTQPNNVGISTGMISFAGYIQLIPMLMQAIAQSGSTAPLLRLKFLNADFFAYEVLLYPVKTRLVMLP